MREIRLSGLEGGGAVIRSPYPYSFEKRPRQVHKAKSASVTAPREALVTWAAYLASTPRV